MNPTSTNAWQSLKNLYEEQGNVHLRQRFSENPNRFKDFSIETDELLFDFSKQHIDNDVFNTLLSFAEEMNLDLEKSKFFNGERINETENRAVLHTCLRKPNNQKLLLDGVDVVKQVHNELNKIRIFTNQVVNGDFKGFSGKKISQVVHIGIGGSDLGPKMIVQSLKSFHNHIKIHFVSNVDSDSIEDVLKSVPIEETLFIIVSKTFTTIETITNAETAKQFLIDYYKDEKAVASHFVAISTSLEKVTEFGIVEKNIFGFWDWVGGRFSLWSSVGLSISLIVGYENFENLLKGAHSADEHFRCNRNKNNIPVIMALLCVWNANFHNLKSLAVIPYSERLSLFTKYLQQLIMESNGKSIDKQGERINYTTSPNVWGEPGTDSQHSFFQFLHQGTEIIPVHFIGFKKEFTKSKHNQILLSNMFAQSRALMEGYFNENSYKNFEGNRPSITMILNKEDAYHIGYLTATYEHYVFVQGVLYNIFSFDQWGVELGKRLALEISNSSTDFFDSSTKGLLNYVK